MAERMILADTSILIDLFRKTDKDNSILVSLVRQGYGYCISAVTDYEIYTGVRTGDHMLFWDAFLETTDVLPFDKAVAKIAVDINNQLKEKRKQIAIPDLFIASTALCHNLPLATLNKKHFERIDGLSLIE